MSKQTAIREIDVDEVAANNPGIDAVMFKDWRQKMDLIERLGLNRDAPSGPPPPRKVQPIGLGGKHTGRSGNIAAR